VAEREAVRTVTGGFVDFALPAGSSEPFGIAFDLDRGDVWFAEYATARIGRILDGDADIYAFFLPVLLKGHAGTSSPVQ
jgi:hypothetical protein